MYCCNFTKTQSAIEYKKWRDFTQYLEANAVEEYHKVGHDRQINNSLKFTNAVILLIWPWITASVDT